MERGAQARRAPGDAPAAATACALPDEGKKPVVGADELPAIGLDRDGIAPAADARVDDRQEDATPRVPRT
jgi:hypothetical protein